VRTALPLLCESLGPEADTSLESGGGSRRQRNRYAVIHNYGLPLSSNWTTLSNGAEFGSDYFTRLAVAKSNIFVNKPNETKYFYQDLDSSGQRLNGRNSYTVTFAKDQVPPVKGF
jgi:hypothetical protein